MGLRKGRERYGRLNVRAKVTITAAAALMALAGCSSGDGGGSKPAPTGPKLPHDGAPKVTNPIADTSKLSADPCSVLAASDRAALKVASATPKLHTVAGDTCNFTGQSGKMGSTSGTLLNSKAGGPTEGLSTTFANAKSDGTKLRTVGPYSGHPAVEQPIKGDSTSCEVIVGLSDQLAYGLTVTDSDKTFGSGSPCQKAEKFTTRIMKNITQGG